MTGYAGNTIFDNRYDVAEYLIENGMRPDSERDTEFLYTAMRYHSLPMLRLLLPFFDLNRPGPDGRTPLFEPQITEEVAECLVQAGAKADYTDPNGVLPYQVVIDEKASEYLKDLYFELHPVAEFLPATVNNSQTLDWSNRFMTTRVSIADLVPVDCDQATGKFKIQFDNHTYFTSERFITSFARKLKFSTNIFNYFSAEEVFDRVYQRNPDVAFKVTFDRQDGEILGVVDESKKILPAEIACNVFASDPRIQSIHYSRGVWEAEFQLDETFSIRNDSPYTRKIWVHYPVDGVTRRPHRPFHPSAAKKTIKSMSVRLKKTSSWRNEAGSGPSFRK